MMRTQKVNVIFNYSQTKLTQPMEEVLNKGLKFAVLPDKTDLTQVLVDYKYFARSMLWQEYFHGKETEERAVPIFKLKKNNLPKKHTTPEGLKTYLGAVICNL